MGSLGTFFLLHVFTAVLPPLSSDKDEDEYYHVLGFDSPSMKRISQEDIRKAYRALSLQLHPDKIAQRGGNAAEAAAKYEKVQQAYAVLSDPAERQKYHVVNCSVHRYKFIYHQGWMHPMNLLQNLASASCVDKFRLILVLGFISLFVLLQPILLAAKVNAILGTDPSHLLYDTKWNVVLIPFYVLYGLSTALQLAMFVLTNQRDVLLTSMQHSCFLVGIVFFCREWDEATSTGRPMDSVNWFKLATPFYLALGFRVAALSEAVKAMSTFHARIVSPDKMAEIQHEKEKDGAFTEEQMEALRAEYVICNPNDLEVAATLALLEKNEQPVTDEDVEAIKVGSSPEFRHLEAQISKQQAMVVQTLFYGATLITLICAKIEHKITCSWWVVFVPLWVFFGLRILWSCTTVCWAGGSSIPDDDDDDDSESEQQHQNQHPEGGGGQEGPDDDEYTRDHEDEPAEEIDNKNTKGKNINNNNNKWKLNNNKSNSTAKKESGDNKATTNSKAVGDDKKAEEPTNKSLPKSHTFPSAGEKYKADKEESLPKSKTFTSGKDRDTPKQQETDEDYSKNSNENENVIEERPGQTISPKQPNPLREYSTKFDNAQSSRFFESAATKVHDQEEKEEAEQTLGTSSDTENVRPEEVPELDEGEAFRQWQRQHAQEADSAAAEAAVSATMTCCTSLFQLVTACLIVAKLEDAYSADAEDDDMGFDAYWILFPVFLIVFLVMCCCCYLVYSTQDISKMEEFMQQQQNQQQQDPEQQQSQAGATTHSFNKSDVEQGSNAGSSAYDPIMFPPQPEQPAAAAANSEATSFSQHDNDVESGDTTKKTEAPTDDINDLD